MLIGSTIDWGEKSPRAAAIEWGCLIFLVCLIYKLEYLGVGVLVSIVGLGFFDKRTGSFPLSLTNLWGVLYVSLATVTAFQVSSGEGLYRTAQGLLVVLSGFVIVRHFRTVSAGRFDAFINRLVFLGVCVFLHVIIYHLMIHRYTGWKTLYDTKIVFSLLPVLLFTQENKIRERLSNLGWLLLLGGLAALIVISGERKAYILFVGLLFMSNARGISKIVVSMIAVVSLAAVVNFGSNAYIEKHILSFFESHKEVSMEELYANEDLAYDSDLIRTFVNRHAREQFLNHPVIGLGATGYQAWANKKFRGLTYGLTTNVHGEINRVPVENGLIGIGVALAYFYGVTSRVLFHMRGKKWFSMPSREKLPLYLLMFIVPYTMTEAMNTLMMEIFLLFGAYAATLKRTSRSPLLQKRIQ